MQIDMANVRASIAMAGIVGAVACGAAQHAGRPECSDRALLELEARYVTEVMIACDGQSYDTCEAREEIDAKFDALRKEWVYCK